MAELESTDDTRTRLRELALLFLRLGATAFGGPAAHIAMMEDEVVRRRQWVSRDDFLDLIAATNFIPGPNSTEMAIHIGLRRAGWKGLIVAGCCFIIPATIIVGLIAWAYTRYGELPVSTSLLYGIKPVIIAVVLQALWRLGRAAIKTWLLAAITVAAAALNFSGIHELIVLAGAGLSVMLLRSLAGLKRPPKSLACLLGIFCLPAAQAGSSAAVSAGAAAAAPGLWPVFLFFLKVGSVLFGSGYVLLAFLQGDLVERYQWLTQAQLLDATAVGQVTPGPVFTTATFIGYLLAGPAGAGVATAGIFLPAFFFVAISSPLIPRLRRSRLAGWFLDGLNVASLALMAVVTWTLFNAAVVDWLTAALLAISLVLLIWRNVNSTWLVLGGGLIGIAAGRL